jgi:hypothetical protein
MKIIGLLLILGALVGGGIILSDTIPGYFENKNRLARTRNEAADVEKKLAAIGANATEAEILSATRSAEQVVQQIRFDEDSVARRRDETLMFGGGALAVLALGTLLFLRGRKQQKQKSIGAATAPTSLAV